MIDAPSPSSSYRPLPAAPDLRRRNYVDGLLQIPVDVIRDPSLGSGDKTVACALAALSFGSTEVIELNSTIQRHCGIQKRQIEAALNRLEAAGWIIRAKAPKTKHRRRIILLWKLPDDFGDLAHPERPARNVRRVRPAAREQLPLFGDRQGGEP